MTLGTTRSVPGVLLQPASLPSVSRFCNDPDVTVHRSRIIDHRTITLNSPTSKEAMAYLIRAPHREAETDLGTTSLYKW